MSFRDDDDDILNDEDDEEEELKHQEEDDEDEDDIYSDDMSSRLGLLIAIDFHGDQPCHGEAADQGIRARLPQKIEIWMLQSRVFVKTDRCSHKAMDVQSRSDGWFC